MDMIRWLFGTGDYMSHGHCYLWDPALMRLHFISDLAIGVAYVAISVALIVLVLQGKREIPFHWMFVAFGTFLIACGATHLMEVWTLWTPLYWLSGTIKAVTALASVTTAFAMPFLVPRSLALVRAANLSVRRGLELEAVNAALRTEVAERKRAEDEVRRLNAELEARVRRRTAELVRANEELAEKAAIVEHSYDAIFSKTLDGVITSWNPAAERVYGYGAREITGKSIGVLVPPDKRDELANVMARLQAGDLIAPFETVRVRKGGEAIEVYITISPIKDAEGKLQAASVIARDITERKRAEGQLREMQKLESLGVIAGGVAHDFNNLLVGILGNASLVLDSLAPSNPNHSLLRSVVDASERAAHLTRQLLAYAGKGRFVIAKVDLSALVTGIAGLIRSSIPKTVQLRFDLARELPAIDADPEQIQQLLMNLVINGAEAIGEGNDGTVSVTTKSQEVDEEYARQNFAAGAVRPGTYVSLRVEDTGCGMDAETTAKIFDPFFTTKFMGRGLGLSAVLGIVRGHKGAIRVSSAPAKGSAFEVLLPVAGGCPDLPPAESARQQLAGPGTILVNSPG
jgi:two-component system, cell cycle sensor histidine kinase and response regulator CckA